MRITASACTAKASFNSMTPMSSSEQAGQRESFRNRDHRPDAHDLGWHAGDREADEARHRLQSPLRAFCRRYDRRGRAVAGLRRIAGGHRAVGLEYRLQLGERFERSIGARAFVLAKLEGASDGGAVFELHLRHIDRHNLIVEVAFRLRGKSVLMAAIRERIGILAGYGVAAVQALGGQPHTHVDLGR